MTMKLPTFRHKISDSPDGTTTLTTDYTFKSSDLVNKFITAKIFKEAAIEISQRLADDLYDDILKSVDKDTTVREVSIQVSENILAKMYGDKND